VSEQPTRPGLILTETDRRRFVRRNTMLLAAGQASIWMTVGVFVAAGPVAVVHLSGRASLGGLMFAIWSISLAIGAQVAGVIMDRFGRRPGLSAGQALLGLASLAACVSVLNGSAAGLLASSIVGGLGAGAALLGRAAIADMYPPEQRGTAVGFMLAAGTVGAILGPQLVQVTRILAPNAGQPAQLAAAWIIAALISSAALVGVLALRPDPRELAPPQRVAPAARRPLGTLLRLPAMRGALLGIALAQFAMTGLMAVYAIAASARGVGIGVIALILSAHFSGMFAFSPVWGTFLDRVGRREGLLAGTALVAVGGLITGLPQAAVSATGLFLVGLGWSGAYLGATAVVSDLTTPAERGTALGFTDLLTAGASAGGALIAGVVLDWSGFSAVGAGASAVLLAGVILLFLVPRASWRRALA
jgi:MFS family permease